MTALTEQLLPTDTTEGTFCAESVLLMWLQYRLQNGMFPMYF